MWYELLPKILNMSLTGGVVILAVLLARLLLRRAPKVFSYAMWAVVLFRLLCPVSITSNISLLNIFDTPVTETGSIEYIPSDIVHVENPTVALPVPGVNETINEILPQGEEQLVADPLEFPTSLMTYIWFAGIAVLLIYSVVQFIRLRRKLVGAVPLCENIYLADHIASPFVLGLFRPKIFLPSSLSEVEQEYIIQHEKHHIRRGDHVTRILAFAALCVHWFNPLVWLSFVLSGNDMEMSCDEAVMKRMDGDIRADYSASLLHLATGRRIISGTPLAFGEGDTGGRIKNVLNYKKPTFWVIIAAVVVCVIAAVCLLTNPRMSNEFPMEGINVSDLDPQLTTNSIAAIVGLNDGSQLNVSSDNFDLMLTSDFDWASSGAIRFFYTKNRQTFGSQLRLFFKEGSFFVTNSTKWPEQDRVFKLQHYLEALKYLPREEIRQLSPEADGYSVLMFDVGAPKDYERCICYTSNGTGSIDGWYIQLELQPLHNQGNAYSGTGDEVIHLFYGSEELSGASYQTAYSWVNYSEDGYNAMVERAENRDTKRKYGNVQHLTPVVKLDSKADFDDFYREMSGFFSFTQDYDESVAFEKQAKQYDEDFFSANSLFIAYLTEGTGSNRHELEEVRIENGVLEIRICRFAPDNGDTVMAGWFLAVAIPKADIADCTGYDAYICATVNPDQQIPSGNLISIYAYKEGDDIMHTASVSLYDSGEFMFTFSPLSSYIGHGTYTIENDRLTLKTGDGDFTYVFDMVDDTLVFDAGASSSMAWYSGMEDGSVFQ